MDGSMVHVCIGPFNETAATVSAVAVVVIVVVETSSPLCTIHAAVRVKSVQTVRPKTTPHKKKSHCHIVHWASVLLPSCAEMEKVFVGFFFVRRPVSESGQSEH